MSWMNADKVQIPGADGHPLRRVVGGADDPAGGRCGYSPLMVGPESATEGIGEQIVHFGQLIGGKRLVASITALIAGASAEVAARVAGGV